LDKSMNRLPNSLFDQTRSYLNFKELHHVRRVSKAWTDIVPIPKKLTLQCSEGSTSKIAVHANFDKIIHFSTHMSVYGYYLSEEEREICQKVFNHSAKHLHSIYIDISSLSDLNLQVFPNLKSISTGAFEQWVGVGAAEHMRLEHVKFMELVQNATNLKELDVGNLDCIQVFFQWPIMMHLTHLCLSDGFQSENIQTILEKSPNLTHFQSYDGEEFTIDFSKNSQI